MVIIQVNTRHTPGFTKYDITYLTDILDESLIYQDILIMHENE